MSKNEVYAEWKRQNPEATKQELENRFVAKNWSKFIDGARATLTRLLLEPIDQALKDEIEEALVLDASLIRGRRDPKVLMGSAN
jgi:hypothetical protein